MSAYSLQGPNIFVRVCIGSALAIALNLALPHPASAASCLPLLERTPSLELQLFAEDTSNVLHYALSDDDKLESKVTNYLATDPELLSVMRDLILQVPSSRRYALGRALGRAALHCSVDPALARKFSAYVAVLRDANVMAGYTSATPLNGVQLGTIGQSGPNGFQFGTNAQAAPNGAGQTSFFTGEFGTELADPFKLAPLPQ